MLCRAANGFGGLAVAFLAHGQAATRRALNPMAPQPGHFQPKAKSVIFLYMDGGPSQVDTFDPKPRLAREHGQPIRMETPPTQFNDNGNVMRSPWEFRKRGQSGLEVSDLLPHIATCADDLAVIRSMVADNSEHTAANYQLHTGFSMQGRPAMGAWITYGLGSESENLPGFVVLDSGLIPAGGMDNFGSGFLPAAYQGTLFRRGSKPVANVEPREASPEIQLEKLGLLKKLNRGVLDRLGSVTELEAAVANYELAYRMQSAVPELIDLRGESKATLDLYGIQDKDTEDFGRQCLLARRLVERGVRFVECLTPKRQGVDRWDQHGKLFEGHTINARATDQPVAALLKDLKSRGLLDQTLVVWGAEFGRTPMSQGTNGRDHNPFGFTMWLAGGGVRGGTVYGATDDYGYFAVENKVHIHDLHATILHLLGLDHKQLTYRFSGRDMRLTDVAGEVIRGILV
ncbi:MAG: DUF1501 domain-containing protein [Acidobacteria bacterium]|nr:DUF1501 domain-containing protein [Acidobacteriota bacterium]